MSGRASIRHASPSEQFRDHADFLRWELSVDERAGPPLRARRKWPRWLAVAILALAAGSWAAIDDKPAALAWFSSHAASALELAKVVLGEAERISVPEQSPPLQLAALRLIDARLVHATLVEELPNREIGLSQVAVVNEPEAETAKDAGTATTSSHTETVASEPEKPAPLPPLPPLTDPLQKRAEAAGLHPELSRALLQSLTPADFKNAAIAIKKAIAETPEDGVLVWPAKPGPGSARFRIHFVPGISPACRRYVVGVAKSGWLTTALPMERCGVKPRLARSYDRAPREPRAAQRP